MLFELIQFRNEDVDNPAEPSPKIEISIPEQSERLELLTHTKHSELSLEKPDAKELSIIDDCDQVPPTIILNQQLIVDYKYAHFHHDDEDVQENSNSFIADDRLEPNILCSGIKCNDIFT